MKEKRIASVSLFIQIVLLVQILFVGISSLFLPFLGDILQILIALLLFIMAYNNKNIFKRKGFTVVYILGGIFLLLSFWIGW